MGAEVVDLQLRREEKTQRPGERLLTKAELAAHFGVTERTINRYVRDERYSIGGELLPSLRLPGGALRFRLSEVEAWISRAAL